MYMYANVAEFFGRRKNLDRKPTFCLYANYIISMVTEFYF